MVIVYSGDSNYFPHIGVSIASLVSHNKVDKVYLLTDSKSVKDAWELIAYTKGQSINLQILIVDLSRLKLKVSGKVTLAAYYRLLLPDLLPEDRVIYLDGDTIINGPLDAMWNVDLDGNAISAVEDVSANKGLKEKLFGRDIPYFNDGAMLLDLMAFREEGLTKRMLDFAQCRKEKITYHDQCVLNYFLQDKWLKLPEKYNVMACHLLNKKMFADAVANPVIIHYNSYFGKPWDVYCTHPMKDKYLEVKAKTPWKSLKLTRRDRLTFYRRKIPALNLFLIVLRRIINSFQK